MLHGKNLNFSTRWYSIVYRAAILVWHNGTLFMLEKRLLFENGINQILIKQLKLYSVVCCIVVTCML